MISVDQTDLANGIVSVVGNSGIDTLAAAGSSLDLRTTTLSGIEVLKAGSSDDTTFTVDQTDLAANGSVVGDVGTDTLIINGTSLNLGTTTLSGVEILKAGMNAATTFTVDQSDLATNGSVVGSIGIDTLVAAGTMLGLSATALTSVEILKAGTTSATTFIVDQADLATGGSVIGTGQIDTLIAAGASLSLT
ncbi:hypothetical protein, partial [Magnetospirillum fulvum]